VVKTCNRPVYDSHERFPRTDLEQVGAVSKFQYANALETDSLSLGSGSLRAADLGLNSVESWIRTWSPGSLLLVGFRSARFKPARQTSQIGAVHATSGRRLRLGTAVHLGEPGLLPNVLVLSALPAFLLGRAVVFGLARLGVSEVASFESTMPVLILGWPSLVGWLLDRWQHKRSLRRASACSRLS